MNSVRIIAACLMFSVVSVVSVVQAQVYRTVDKQGNVIYSDKPAAQSEEIKSEEIYVPPVQTYSAPKLPKKAAPSGAAGPAKTAAPVRYKIAIVAPADDSTVRQNEGSLTISVSVKPNLKGGDKVRFFIDGKSIGKASVSTSVVAELVERGTHTLGAQVINRSGRVRARAKSVTVHMKRFSISN